MRCTLVLDVEIGREGVEQEADGARGLIEAHIALQLCGRSRGHGLFHLVVLDVLQDGQCGELVDDDHRVGSDAPGDVERVGIVVAVVGILDLEQQLSCVVALCGCQALADFLLAEAGVFIVVVVAETGGKPYGCQTAEGENADF